MKSMYMMEKKTVYLTISLIFIAALARFISPWPNVTPLGAMALLGGSYLSKRWMGAIIPVSALWISNLVLNNTVYAGLYDGFVWFGASFWAVAGSMLLISLLGKALLSQKSAGRVIGASIAASVLFFLVTNFGVWLNGLLYPMNGTGLVAAYAAGLPFFLNTLVGDLFFTGILFGVLEYSLRTSRQAALAK